MGWQREDRDPETGFLKCDHCQDSDESVEEDRFANVLCSDCAMIVAEEEWEE